MSVRGIIRPPSWPRLKVVALVVVVAAVVTAPFAILAVAFWAASEPWEFSGKGLRYWLFVRGSTLDQLGIVEGMGEPVRYIVQIQEGTDPGEISAAYRSAALPKNVVGTYAERCRRLGLAIRKRDLSPDAAEGTLVCAGDPTAASSDDAWVTAEREAGTSTTRVRLRVGPGLTLIYSF